MCSGGRYTGGRQHHRASDITTAAAGLSLHPVLRVQTLPGQEDQEEEERHEAIRFHCIGELLIINMSIILRVPVLSLASQVHKCLILSAWSIQWIYFAFRCIVGKRNMLFIEQTTSVKEWLLLHKAKTFVYVSCIEVIYKKMH